jgi:hypothetical protein
LVHRLAVGFAAVADAGDLDEIATEVAEEDAVVLGAEAVEGRIDALKAADVAFLRFQEPGQSAKDRVLSASLRKPVPLRNCFLPAAAEPIFGRSSTAA